MADDEQIDQDEIEKLLAQATGGDDAGEEPPQQAAAPPPAAAAPTDGGDAFSLGQDEIEALMSGDAPPAAAPAAAGGFGAMPAAEAPVGLPPGGDYVAGNDVELLLDRAEAAIASLDDPAAGLPDGVAPFRLESFGGTPANEDNATLELVRDVQLDLRIELGRTRMSLENVLRLRREAVVALDKLAGDPVDVYANGRLIARGEVLVLNDNFCVRVTELIVGDSAVA